MAKKSKKNITGPQNQPIIPSHAENTDAVSLISGSLDTPCVSNVQADLDLDEEEWSPNLQFNSSKPNWDASDTEDDIDSEDEQEFLDKKEEQ